MHGFDVNTHCKEKALFEMTKFNYTKNAFTIFIFEKQFRDLRNG